MHHTGRVVSRTELVEHLYDQDFDRDSNTIEVFVGRIRKKLGVDVIQTVRGLGYLLDAARCALTRSRFACSSGRPAGRWSSSSSPASCLSSLYRHAVERAFDRRLDVYLRTLVADVASPEEGNDKFPQSIGEPLFELPLSGWYWQVTRLDTPKPEVHSSRSLWDSDLPRLPEAADRAAAAERLPAGLCAGPRGRSGCASSSATSISATRAAT